jgi:hypothetical protein
MFLEAMLTAKEQKTPRNSEELNIFPWSALRLGG